MKKQQLNHEQILFIEHKKHMTTDEKLRMYFNNAPRVIELFTFDQLFNALAYGYELVESPEEKVYTEYYSWEGVPGIYADGMRRGIKFALDNLDIKIKGVND